MVGIYRIRNLINDKSYYGSSKQIEKRWSTHRNELNKKTHSNCILQRAWNKYGEVNFLFEIIEVCDSNVLLKVEQKYLDTNPDYNIGIKSSGGDNLSRNPRRDEIVKKMSNSLKKRYDSMTDEEKKQKLSQPLEENPNWKGGISISSCEICNKRISQNAKRCMEHIEYARNGVCNSFYGKKHSDEAKKKISESRKGKKPSNTRKIEIEGVVYEGLNDASIHTGIKETTIWHRIHSKNKKYENYKYID
jgi:group I intron endonuclease